MGNINFNYDFNTTYYYNKMISVPRIEKCLYCENGKHKRVGDGKIVECPVCKGIGEINTQSGSIKEEPRKCFLFKIKTNITKEDYNCKYIFVDEDNKIISATIYDDIDECIKGKVKAVMGYTTS